MAVQLRLRVPKRRLYRHTSLVLGHLSQQAAGMKCQLRGRCFGGQDRHDQHPSSRTSKQASWSFTYGIYWADARGTEPNQAAYLQKMCVSCLLPGFLQVDLPLQEGNILLVLLPSLLGLGNLCTQTE